MTEQLNNMVRSLLTVLGEYDNPAPPIQEAYIRTLGLITLGIAGLKMEEDGDLPDAYIGLYPGSS